MTTEQAAKAANCSKSLILGLIKKGKIKAQQGGPRGHWNVTMSKADIKMVVAESSPTAGWKKNGHTKKAGGKLSDVLEFAGFDDQKRALLIDIGNRATNQELEVIATLIG